ncbi:hypothetical protein CEJ86_24460 [Sinorhizobium meliloti]|uniref:Uncharacterized protein n=1 Tax=Rhizobium meliloti TaxID=382 RepID=A0A2J0YWW5_RHIML|nr:hypothetical protein CEJ86_24460 [Sinorhizobium meliloti]
MSHLPEEVKKTDIHRFALKTVDYIFRLPRFFRDHITFKADFDLNANIRLATKKSPLEVDDARK